MTYHLTSQTTGSLLILAIFGVVILIVGAYMLYTVKQMKTTNKPPAWLFTESDYKRIKKPEEMCKELRPWSVMMGVACIVFGIYSVVVLLFIGMYALEVAGVVFLLVFVALYFVQFSKMKDKYIP